MRNHTIDIDEYIRNGIEDELRELEENGSIRFHDAEKRTEFVNDLQADVIEQFENDTAYYGKWSPDFADAVSDAIQWDGEYYGIEEMEE